MILINVLLLLHFNFWFTFLIKFKHDIRFTAFLLIHDLIVPQISFFLHNCIFTYLTFYFGTKSNIVDFFTMCNTFEAKVDWIDLALIYLNFIINYRNSFTVQLSRSMFYPNLHSKYLHL